MAELESVCLFKPSDMQWLRVDRPWNRYDFVLDSRSFRLLYEALGGFGEGRTKSLRFLIRLSRRYSAWMFRVFGV